MSDTGTFSLFLAPALGFLACAGLYLVTAILDRRALRNADQLERQAAEG